MRLEQAVDRGFRDEVLALVDEAHRQLARREFRHLQRQRDDLTGGVEALADRLPRPSWHGLQRLQPMPGSGHRCRR